MGKVILYIATTLDGKIARNNGSLDWLYALPNPNQIDHGYAKFIDSIGTTIMGRKTYDEIISFGVDWPYKEMKSYVATNNESFSPETPNTWIISSSVTGLTQNLRESSEKDIWLIGGGQLITHFLNNDLLDRMILTIIPTILGNGISLFPNQPKETNWVLSDVEQFETGVTNLTYDKK
ncbi:MULTISPECIES: dihydrofolate reductase family protein [Bacteroidales]|uniref:dihydrofolate reductase family protein n=1 Tax=Bacteroidales TaxID=171549 RepID=UPI000F005266|nr:MULTISPECIES: dihydrofolate reductase family protein [Bacteroidales]RHR83500.1 dihydrofolate reductase [Bacteroides sp. AF16-49]